MFEKHPCSCGWDFRSKLVETWNKKWIVLMIVCVCFPSDLNEIHPWFKLYFENPPHVAVYFGTPLKGGGTKYNLNQGWMKFGMNNLEELMTGNRFFIHIYMKNVYLYKVSITIVCKCNVHVITCMSKQLVKVLSSLVNPSLIRTPFCFWDGIVLPKTQFSGKNRIFPSKNNGSIRFFLNYTAIDGKNH